jgi:predicted transcriptional regulator
MNKEVVGSIVVTLRLMEDNSARIPTLVEILGGVKLTGHGKSLASTIIQEFWEENTLQFGKDLKEFIGGPEFWPTFPSDMHEFIVAVAGKLEADIIIEKELNYVVTSFFYSQVEFLYMMMTAIKSESSRGVSNRLVRNFAQACDLGFLIQKINALNDEASVDPDFINSLSDGYNIRKGSTDIAVLNITIEERRLEVESDLRINCNITNPSDVQLRERKRLLNRLADLSPKGYPEKWMRQNFPHLVSPKDGV